MMKDMTTHTPHGQRIASFEVVQADWTTRAGCDHFFFFFQRIGIYRQLLFKRIFFVLR
jgi:hypothetical protein